MKQKNYLPVLVPETKLTITERTRNAAIGVGIIAVCSGGLSAAALYGIDHGNPGPIRIGPEFPPTHQPDHDNLPPAVAVPAVSPNDIQISNK